MKSNKTIKRLSALTMAAALAMSTVALHASDHDKAGKKYNTEHKEKKPYSDTSFIEQAALGNLGATRMGEIAQQKGENAEVKAFGQKLVSDHRQANEELKPLAQKLGVAIPTSLDRKFQDKLGKIQNANGAEFDKEFAKCAVKGHKMALSCVEEASMKASDPQVKAYAQQSAAKMRQHLQAAQSLARTVGVDEATLSALDQEDDNEAAGTPGVSSESGQGQSDQSEKYRDKSNQDGSKSQNDPYKKDISR